MLLECSGCVDNALYHDLCLGRGGEPPLPRDVFGSFQVLKSGGQLAIYLGVCIFLRIMRPIFEVLGTSDKVSFVVDSQLVIANPPSP